MQFVSPELNEYCFKHSHRPSALCDEIEAFTRANIAMSVMLTGPMEAAFLGMLLGLIGARRVLEFGTFTGYSALAMAERLPDGGEVVTLDINPETTQIAKGFWARSPHGHKIRAITGPATQSLAALKGCFDLVFIDADKPNYPVYFRESLKLTSQRGVIVLDNMLWSGRVIDRNETDAETSALRSLNETLLADPQLEVVLLPVRDGMSLVRRKSA